jgi:hypothetical protein
MCLIIRLHYISALNLKQSERIKNMAGEDITYTLLVDQTPDKVFNAINNVRGWWTGDIQGSTNKLNDEFTYRYKDFHYSKQKITEFIPGKKIAWLITDSSLEFLKNKSEWIGTKITFDIDKKGDKTEVRFTHHGIAPGIECYDKCSNAWGSYVNNSLRKLITA